LVKNLSCLRCLLATDKFDVLFVVETWLTDKVTDAMVVGSFPYDIIRLDRDSRGGGLCVIFRIGLNVAVDRSSDEAEAFSIIFPQQKLNFIVGYLPDSYNDQMIDNLAAFIVESIKPCFSNIVLGDFNLSTACWPSYTAMDLHHRRFMDLIAPIGLDQLVNEPTRGDNILDLILVDSDRLVYDIVVQDHLGATTAWFPLGYIVPFRCLSVTLSQGVGSILDVFDIVYHWWIGEIFLLQTDYLSTRRGTCLLQLFRRKW
jgi:hypothetical protein